MTCRTCSNLLSAYRDQELTGREMLAVRDHLSRCSECQEELVALEAIHRALGKLNEVPVPAGLENRIHGAVFRPKPRHGSPLQLAAWGGLAAAAALCAVLFFQATHPVPRLAEKSPFESSNSDLAYSDAADPLGVYVPVFSVSNPGDGR